MYPNKYPSIPYRFLEEVVTFYVTLCVTYSRKIAKSIQRPKIRTE